MRWLFPLLSLICTYAMIGCAYYEFLGAPSRSYLPVVLVLTAAVAVLCIVNIVCAVRAYRRGETAQRLSLIGLVWKLLAIPYFVLNFAAWFMLSMAFVVVPGLQLFLLGLPLAAAATYIPLLTSSAYTVAAILAARRENIPIKKRHLVLELLFITDVIDAAWLYFQLRSVAKEKNLKTDHK